MNLKVVKGAIFGLLGHNGAGKSAVIECILGTKKIETGEVTRVGMNPVIARKKVFARVGVQLQESNYQDKIKVKVHITHSKKSKIVLEKIASS